MFWKYLPERWNTVAIRLTVLYATLSIAILSAGFAAVYYALLAHFQDDADETLVETAEELSCFLRAADDAGLQSGINRETGAHGVDHLLVRVLDDGRNVLFTSDDTAWRALELSKLPAARPRDRRSGLAYAAMPDGSRVRVLTEQVRPGRLFQTAVSMRRERQLLRYVKRIAGFALIAVFLVSMPAGWFLARQAMSGVDAVMRMARRIAEGDYSERVKTPVSGSEIVRLAETFNHMAERIQALIRTMRDLNDDVAHDLRSPLTRIRGLAEGALTASGASPDAQEVAGGVVEECDRLLEMIHTMLEISEAEAGIARLRFEEADIQEIAARAVELFSPMAEDKGLALRQLSGPPCPLRCDTHRVQRALANLIDNAVKYTPAGGTVTVGVRSEGPRMAVSVSDSGPGIPPAETERIFDRFCRGDGSRSHPGNGLGLSLARAIARSHGGDVTLERTGGTGSLFTLVLPRAPRETGARAIPGGTALPA